MPDLLRVPVLGPLLLRRRWLQGVMLALSAVLVLHGFLGPQLAPKNLATLTVWVHYRGLLVLGLLLAGNVFCLSCPFMLPRDWARRWIRRRRPWPRALRGKALGIALLVGVLYAYEVFDLWSSPWATATLVVGYFAAAVLVDVLFEGAPFCKSVCPIGQYNFIASTLSPLEVAVKDHGVCDRCKGHECLRGAPAPQAPALLAKSSAPLATRPVAQRGCELGLFLPSKVGNMDCTFCLDCVRACPEDNVALTTRLPGLELAGDESGAGVGKLTGRRDLSVLAIVFTFGALLNAFGMVSPVYVVQQWLADALGTSSEALVLGILFAIVLVLEPVLLLGLAAAITSRVLPRRDRLVAVAARFAYGLVPLGFGVWLAHYSFHFFTGLWTFVPVAQKAAADAGLPILGTPDWGVGGLTTRAVQPIETGFLLLGLIGSLMVLWLIAKREAPRSAWAAWSPWAVLSLLLFGSGLWLMAQPMEMRGTFLGT